VLWLLVGVVMVAPATAIAQERSPTPSAEQLWREYPLHPGQEPTPTPAESRPASAPAARAEDDGTPVMWPAAALAALLGAAGVLVLRRRGGRRRALSPPDLAGPLIPAAFATAMVPPRSHRPRRLTNLAMDETRSSGNGGNGADMRPPDPARSWTAEVEWRQEGGRARFAVIARSGDDDEGRLVASSAPLAWPPPDSRAVQRLSEAADRLEAALLGAGWTPLPPGSAWYAKRFAWAPAAQPVTALPQATPEPGGRRFERQVEWPPEDAWRCEIRWHAGYVNSRFEAQAHAPGRRRGATVCSSAVFRWLLMADPGHESAEFVNEVRRIAERLTDAGWERAGRGKHWWELRFVWTRDGAPPEHLELEPAEAAATESGEDDAGR
jgi:hypothetical protein